MSDLLAGAVDGLDLATAADLLAACAARIADAAQPAVIGREIAAVVDDRARLPFAVPQWMQADQAPRGLIIQALSFADVEAAERASMDRQKDGTYTLNEFKQILNETARGIVEPSGLTVETLRRWNYESVVTIHRAIRRIGPIPASLIAAELARVAGGSPPPPVDPTVPDGRRPPPDGVGDDAAAAPAPSDDMADD